MNNTEIKKIYFRDVEINSLYWGNNLIYKSGGVYDGEYGKLKFKVNSNSYSLYLVGNMTSNSGSVSSNIQQSITPKANRFNDYATYDSSTRIIEIDFDKYINDYQNGKYEIKQIKFGNDSSNGQSVLEVIKFPNGTKLSDVVYSFNYCSNLTEVSGKISGINYDIDLHYSPLNNDSAMVFINGLSEVDDTKTITFSETTYNTLSDQQKEIATSKRWKILKG